MITEDMIRVNDKIEDCAQNAFSKFDEITHGEGEEDRLLITARLLTLLSEHLVYLMSYPKGISKMEAIALTH